jgi:hypothetical protein
VRVVVHRVDLGIVGRREVLDVKLDESSFEILLLTKSDGEFIYQSVIELLENGRLTSLILVLPGLGVHEYLSHTVERSKDELVKHETNHDWLRAAVGGGYGKSGVEVE